MDHCYIQISGARDTSQAPSGGKVAPPSQVWGLKEHNSHCFSGASTVLLVSVN